MATVKILEGQTLFDIAVQELGDAERVMEIATFNDISITEDLLPGSFIQVPAYDLTKRGIVNLFSRMCIKPASGGITVTEKNEGIDYWEIEKDFIVQ